MQQEKSIDTTPANHQQDQPRILRDKALGSLWGAVLGDVIGAYLEFSRGIDAAKVQEAFLIRGGGMHKLQAGQPTDDSELAYAVGKGLLKGKGTLDLNKIAAQMGNWFISKPIDVGGTIRKSVPKACNMKEHQAYLCRKGALECSKTSQSNGTLMAITPLSLWCMNLPSKDIFQAVREYTILVHPNQLVIFTNFFYTLALVNFLRNPFNSESSSQVKNLNIFKETKEKFTQTIQGKGEPSNIKQFEEWLKFIEDSLKQNQMLEKQLNATKKAGWCRVAFTYSIIILLKGLSFRKSLEYILNLKGDTDTNACIAGGLVGANMGYSRLEAEMGQQIQEIEKWRPKNVKRPDWMVPGLVIANLAQKIVEIAPSELKIVGGEASYPKK